MNAAEFNALYEVGTPVFAYPGARPEDFPKDTRLVTRTRSRASVLGGHTDVVWVDGHSACIALSHVDVVSEAAFQEALLADTVKREGALPVPAGPARQVLDLDVVVSRAVAVARQYDGPDGVDQDDLDQLTDFDVPQLVAEVRAGRIELEKARAQIVNHGPVLVALEQARARITELEAERRSTNEALDDAVQALRVNAEPSPSFAERVAAESDPGRRAAYRMLAEPEPEFHGALHHSYRVGHDLPETGGPTSRCRCGHEEDLHDGACFDAGCGCARFETGALR